MTTLTVTPGEMSAPACGLRLLDSATCTDSLRAALAGSAMPNASGLFSLANMNEFLAMLSPEQQCIYSLRSCAQRRPLRRPKSRPLQ